MSIRQTVDILKRQALSTILQNVSLNSVYLAKTVNQYITNGANSIVSLPEITPTFVKRLSASDFNAKIALAYLDIYAIYILNYANSIMFDQLQTITLSKYQYIMNQYKQIVSALNLAESLKTYKYGIYTDFTTNSLIYPYAFMNNSFGVVDYNRLYSESVLSLPVLTSKAIFPQEIVPFINDSSISSVSTTTSTPTSIRTVLQRTCGNKIGVIADSSSIAGNLQSTPTPTIYGSTNGYIGDLLIIKINSVSIDENLNVLFSYSSSMDNINWSSETTSYSKINKNPIILFTGLQTGLSFSFRLTDTIEVGQSWILSITYIDSGSANCDIKFLFNMIYHLSYLAYDDVSPYKLIDFLDNNGNSLNLLKSTETSPSLVLKTDINRDINHIVPINNTAYSVDINLLQQTYTIGCDKNGGLAFNFEYSLDNVVGYRNEYSQFGAIVFSPLVVQNINTVMLQTNEFIKQLDTASQKSYIVHSLALENTSGIDFIGIVPSDYYIQNPSLVTGTPSVYSYVEPCMSETYYDNITDSVVETNVKIKLNYIIGGAYTLSSIGENVELQLDTSAVDKTVIKFSPDINTFYKFKYNVPVYMPSDLKDIYFPQDNTNNPTSKWVLTNNRCVYAWFIDTDDNNNIKLAVRSIYGDLITNTDGTTYYGLVPYTGKIYGRVFMLSSDENYVSPYIMSYNLNAI